jgi:hypothetical protein
MQVIIRSHQCLQYSIGEFSIKHAGQGSQGSCELPSNARSVEDVAGYQMVGEDGCTAYITLVVGEERTNQRGQPSEGSRSACDAMRKGGSGIGYVHAFMHV